MDSPDGQERSHSNRGPSSRATRTRLLDAAAALIAELGWGRVTTRAVAERADLPHGAVSYHFRGKQELLTEAALHTIEQAMPISELEALPSVSDVVELFGAWLGDQAADTVVSRVGIEAMLESERNPTLRVRLAEMSRAFRTVVADIARADQQRGATPPDIEPAALATLIGAIGDGLFLHARLDPDLDAAAALAALRELLRA
jgi:AcrR family transcriptional regulator